MRRLTRTILITTALLAVAAGTAQAKEVSRVVLCGVDGCRTIDDHRKLGKLVGGGTTFESPGPAADRYRGRMVFDIGKRNHVEHLLYVPGADQMRFVGDGMSGTWTQLSGSSARAWHRAARGLQPFLGRDGLPGEPDPATPDGKTTDSGGEDEAADGGVDAGLIVGGVIALGAAGWLSARRLKG